MSISAIKAMKRSGSSVGGWLCRQCISVINSTITAPRCLQQQQQQRCRSAADCYRSFVHSPLTPYLVQQTCSTPFFVDLLAFIADTTAVGLPHCVENRDL